MRIICLGSAGYFPTEDMETICFMIPELGIIIDAGSGLFRAKKYIQTDTIHLFLTHCHSDHTCGLAYLNAFSKNTNLQIYIHASQFTLDAIQNTFKPPFIGSNLRFIPCVFNTDEISILDNVTVKRFPVQHSVECYGYSFHINNHKLSFITDTFSDGDSAYAQDAANSNLLFHECYLSDDMVNPAKKCHTSSTGLVQFCKSANITNVCFIHHNPEGKKEKVFEELKQSIPTVKMAHDLEWYDF